MERKQLLPIFLGILLISATKTRSQDSFPRHGALREAVNNGIQNTNSFVRSTANLWASDGLSKARASTAKIDEFDEVKEFADKDHAALIGDFLSFQVLPPVEGLLSRLFEDAVCALVPEDSFVFTMPIQVVSSEFTVRNVEGVIAGFCIEPDVTLKHDTFTVEKDTLSAFNIDVYAKELSTQPFRALLTSGEVFIPRLGGDPDPFVEPFTFRGNFYFTQPFVNFFNHLLFKLEKQLPTSGWGSIEKECLVKVEPQDPKLVKPFGCTSKDLQLYAPGNLTTNICTNPPPDFYKVCERFAQDFCQALSSKVVSAVYANIATEAFAEVNRNLPQCLAIL